MSVSEGRDSATRFARIVAIFLSCVGIVYMCRFLVLALIRISYPYQLEWMEGGALEQVRRVLERETLYAEPSIRYVAFIYTPFYFYVSAAAAWVSGASFVPLRLVSIVSALITFGLIFDCVRRETGKLWPGFVAAGIFAAAYDVTGQWMDVARVDSLFLCLSMASIFTLHYFGERWWVWALAAGVLGGLAFLTKQMALTILAPVMLYEAAIQPRRTWLAPVAAAVIAGGVALWLQWRTRGWFLYYVYELPRRHDLAPMYYKYFWSTDMIRNVPVALCVAATAPILLWRRQNHKASVFYVIVAVALIGSAWMSRIHTGGWINVVIPAVAALAILTGIALGLIENAVRKPVLLALFVAVGFQFWTLHRPESATLPTKEDREAGRKFEQLFAGLKGDVLATGQGYLAAKAGKAVYLHTAAANDVLRVPSAASTNLMKEISDALRKRQFSAIILDTDPTYSGFQKEVEKYYRYDRPCITNPDAFAPVTGVWMRPETIWVAK